MTKLRRKTERTPFKKHGLSRHPLYSIWASMKGRCLDENNTHFDYYGGKGIKIFEGWVNDPAAFIGWAVANGWEKGLYLDRIDPSKNYSPENCRFISSKESVYNRSISRKYTYKGETKSLTDWCTDFSIGYMTMLGRLKHMPFDRAITHKKYQKLKP